MFNLLTRDIRASGNRQKHWPWYGCSRQGYLVPGGGDERWAGAQQLRTLQNFRSNF